MHARGRFCQAANKSSGCSGKEKSEQPPKATVSMVAMLDKFHDIIGGIHVPVDDGVDKLNRKYTLLVFLFLALPIFTKQYIGDPIECFAPVYFAEHQSRYINSYCWTQSTYYMVPIGDPEDDGDQQEPPDRIMPDEVDYFIGFETVTHIGNERLRRVRVSYYQWAPLILLVQGLCFYIPFLIWNSCANNAGVKLRRLLKKASDIASLPPGCQQREALLAEFVDQFHTLVTGEAGWCADLQCGSGGGSGGGSSASSAASGSSGSQASGGPQMQQHQHQVGGRGRNEDPSNSGDGRGNHRANANSGGHGQQQTGSTGCCLVSIPIIGSLLACCLKPCSSFGLVGPSKYLCLLYLAVKSAYVFNVGLQFFLLGQFLGRGYLRHGLELLNRLIVNGDWWASPRFPLSTLCQVRADMSGGLRSYTCQCVLPINVFNEKIFSVVWFYMAFLMPLNVLSLLFWIYRTFERNRLSYIRLCLWRTRLVELNQIHRTVRRLSQSYLGWDGVFLLRLIEHNHGSIMATLIMSRLWEFYANQMKLQEDANQLALANNAQHTLSNTTTAISNHQQLMAAAAATNNQIGPAGGAGAGAGATGGGHHGGGGGGHHGGHHVNHSHAPPIMMHATGAGHGNQMTSAGQPHFGPAHGHAHGAHDPGPPGPQQHGPMARHGPPPQIMGQAQMGGVSHGAHAHHSGQISQPGHHPLHAANTHHAHHPGHHLPGPFVGTINAGILAQLQQQQQQQQHHHHAATGNSASAGQPHVTSAQQPASGNVAAAVAALAAVTAAKSTNQSAPGNSTTLSGSQQQQKAGSNASGQVAAAASQHHPSQLHLHSLLQAAGSATTGNAASQQQQQQQQQGSQAAAIQTSGSQGSAAVAVVAAAAASTAASAASQQQQPHSTGLATNQANSSSSSQQQASASSSSSAHTNQTTSFITAASSSQINTSSGQPGSGPPLPPPPPAHVVAKCSLSKCRGII